jgi:ATP-binding cassette subfamily B protein
MIFGKTVNKYYLKYAHLFLMGLIALVFVDYFQLEIPALTGTLVDELVNGTMDRSGLLDFVGLVSIYVSIIIVGRFAWRLFIFGASRRVDYGLRNEMFSHAEKLSNNFYSENKIGGLMAYFTNDLEAVRRAVLQKKKECEEMPHEETLILMRQMDQFRKEWGVKFPFE